MRHWIYLPVLFAFALLGGCTESGDLGAFILREIKASGWQVKEGLVVPRVEARWKVERVHSANTFRQGDDVRIFVTNASATEIDRLLQQILGAPQQSDDGSHVSTGLPQRGWGQADMSGGISISLAYRPNGVEIFYSTHNAFRF